MRPLVLAFVGVLAMAATASAAGDVRATMSTSSTMPLVDTPWRYTIVVKDRAGKPLAAKVRLQILLGPTVVGCWKGAAMTACSGANAGTWISFKGKRTGTLTWPAQSAGVKLTFQATIVAGTRSLRLRAPVTVQRT
jgi:hypothetical protein